MRAIIQRVKNAHVEIENRIVATIEYGILALIAIGYKDTFQNVDLFLEELVNMKLFEGPDGRFSYSIPETQFEILLVSQFTLYGEMENEKWSFEKSAKTKIAKELYLDLIFKLKTKIGNNVLSGQFGAYMNVILNNDGPVTFVYDN